MLCVFELAVFIEGDDGVVLSFCEDGSCEPQQNKKTAP